MWTVNGPRWMTLLDGLGIAAVSGLTQVRMTVPIDYPTHVVYERRLRFRLFAALPTALALTLTEDDQRERKLTLLLSQTRIKLGRLPRMGALALRTKRRSERRRIEFATDRAGSAPRE